jgi:hypothetical protein
MPSARPHTYSNFRRFETSGRLIQQCAATIFDVGLHVLPG